MGVRLGDALVFIRGDRSKFGSDLDAAEKQTQGWASKLSDSTKKLIGGVIVGGATAAAGAVIGIGSAALSTSSQIRNATQRLRAQLGLSEEDAAAFGETIKRVYGDNFGESIDDVGQAIVDVSQQINRFGELSQQELGDATERALALRDAFDIDVSESTNAAAALMENFGLSADEAFTFVQSGLQNGLNRSDDFLDTITEYSVQFKEGGATAAEFFSVMDTGLQTGMLGTDKAGDLFKEFRLRIQDGSQSTADALKSIGLSVDDVTQGLNDGSLTVMDVFNDVSMALRHGPGDELENFNAGVALMGSQFEDLGMDAVGAIDPLALTMQDIADIGGDLSVQYQDFGTRLEGLKRKALIGLTPLGDKLLDIADRAMPYVEAGLQWFADQLPGIIAVGEEALASIWRWFEELLPPAIDFLVSKVWPLIETFSPLVLIIRALSGEFNDVLIPILAMLSEIFNTVLIPAFNMLIEALKIVYQWFKENVLPVLVELATFLVDVLGVVVGEVAAFIQEIFGQLVAWVQENWPLIQETIHTIMVFIQNLITTILTAIQNFWTEHGEAIVAFVVATWENIKAFISAALDVIMGVIRAVMQIISGDWSGAWETIKGVAASLWDGIKALIATAIDAVKVGLQIAMDGIKSGWDEAWNGIKSLVSEIWEGIKGLISDGIDAGKKAINDGLKAIRLIFEFIWDGIVTAVTGVWEDIKGIVKGGIEAAAGILEGIIGRFTAAGSAIVDAIRRGIENAWDTLKGWFKDRLDDLASMLPWSEPKDPSSPLRGLSKSGEAIARNIMSGLEQAMPLLQAQFSAGLGRMMPATAGATNYGPTFQIEAHYRNVESEGSLRDDIRMYNQLYGGR